MGIEDSVTKEHGTNKSWQVFKCGRRGEGVVSSYVSSNHLLTLIKAKTPTKQVLSNATYLLVVGQQCPQSRGSHGSHVSRWLICAC